MDQNLSLLLVASAAVLVLFGAVYAYQKMMNRQAKYGFLGKSLAALTTALFAAGVIGGVQLLQQDNVGFDASAALAEIVIEVESCEVRDAESATYTLVVDPKLTDRETGLPIDLPEPYNIYWSIDPTTANSISKSETGLTADNKGGIVVDLDYTDSHRVIALVQDADNNTYTAEETIICRN